VLLQDMADIKDRLGDRVNFKMLDELRTHMCG